MRQIAQVVAGARAKLVVKGTPKQVVDMCFPKSELGKQVGFARWAR